MSELFIPPKTVEKLNGSHPEGTRHKIKIDLALSLLGQGLSDAAVGQTIMDKFPQTSPKELEGIMRWAGAKNPTPAEPRNGNYKRESPLPRPKELPKDPKARAGAFLGAASVSTADMASSSPETIPGCLELQAECLFSALYQPQECVNILCKFDMHGDRPTPSGAGKTLTSENWRARFLEKGNPSSEIGAWMRLNPCAPAGSSPSGAVVDADITAFRFVLLESDILPIEQQLAFFKKIPVSIAAVILSGGKSAHAWAWVGASSREDYTGKATRLLKILEPFGFDPANKNPSRLCRMPGVIRQIGAHGNGEQRLLYLNPKPDTLTDDALDRLETILKAPALDEFPMREIVARSVDRHQELYENRGKTGTMTGIAKFDEITGGLKRKQMVVLAAESKGGKSSLALNIAHHAAVISKQPVAMFTMEMDQDELLDLLICINRGLDRNLFNTGFFKREHWSIISDASKEIRDSPLYIVDEPVQTVESIRATVMRLKAERGLALVIVDYLQLVTPLESFNGNREQQIASIGRSLRVLAKDAAVPVVALSQLNDEGKLRESRAVGHDAHAIMILEDDGEPPKDFKAPRDLVLKITRARSIPKGSFHLHYEPIYCRMTGTDKQPEPYTKPARKKNWHDDD